MHIAYKEYRCPHCSKLLFKGLLIDSIVEVKCKRCAAMSEFKGSPLNKFICLIEDCPGRIAVANA